MKIDDEFWAPRIKTCRDVTLPYCLATCEKTGRISNFAKAAGLAEGKFVGAHFNDSDVFKVLEGAAYVLGSWPDPGLEKLTDGVIAQITAAQQPDGYLNTFFTIDNANQRFQHIFPNARHELYCMGHMIEAGAVHFEMTGKRNMLEVARKLADHIASIFGPGKRQEVPEHQELELALIKLYRVTGEKKYLNLARFFIDQRGDADGHQLYGAYSQDHSPVRQQSEIVGHAVRAMYNSIGMADLYLETGDAELLAACRRLWQSATHRKMYVTGGLGATPRGEAFLGDYELPNDTAYAETCAQIGLIFFAHRMFLVERDAEYIDVLERVLYNGFLSGVSLSGTKFFYQNRLATRGDYRRQSWYGCACCPSNIVRVFPQIGRYVYARCNDSVFVNLYASGTARLKVKDTLLTLTQETRYPWNGQVKLKIEPDAEREFDVFLRIPGWCRDLQTPGGLYRYRIARADRPEGSAAARVKVNVNVAVNGVRVDARKLDKGYLRIRRHWKAGDVIDLDLSMPVLRVRAHPAVVADRGRVALQRGPIVYCLEGVDHARPIRDVILPPDAELEAVHRNDLLGGVTVITGTARMARAEGPARDIELLGIPYFAWDNREGGEMAVWLTEDPERTRPWRTSRWVGSNYTPAYCVNQLQMWHEFRPEVIAEELAAARKYFGITSLRVYLHDIVYLAEREKFLARLEQFLAICDRHTIRPGFVFFDDCHRHEGITLESLPPVKGWHNGRWAACPQDRDRKAEHLPKLRSYVQDVIRAHAKDRRVLWWEIFNEPNMRSEFSVDLRRRAYAWAKRLEPIQPVISCWDANAATDIVDAHNYSASFAAWDRQVDLDPSRGAVFTEAGARWYAPRASSGEPCEVIHWLETRKAAGKYVPGVYLCWELMVGNSNCRWYWGTKPNTPEPTVPWCGLLWPDGTPVSLAEAESIHRYTTGKRRALFFDDFQAPPPARPGWIVYGAPGRSGSGVLKIAPGQKLITGDTKWSDYVLEARVMLEGKNGNAGVVFRVNHPGPGANQMRGYYAGFDTKTLYLGKMENNWQPLATFDIRALECRVVPGVWNLLRVAVEGARIRVWFDRMHHDDGLRIDYTDGQAPVLSGSVGLRTHGVGASFDNVVVLPISALPVPNDDGRPASATAR